MIIIYHDNKKIVALSNSNNIDKANDICLSKFISLMALEHPNEILVWCHIQLKQHLDTTIIEQLFHHRKLLFSYNPSGTFYMDRSIGYVEESPFIKVNKLVTFPTWQMSSWVGAIHLEVILALNNQIPLEKDFDYFLSSLAKLGMRKGLLCYSEPRLLKQQPKVAPHTKSSYTLFRFVKQHYKMRWIFLLLLNSMVYERKFPVLPFLYSFFYKNRMKMDFSLANIKVQSSLKVGDKNTVDVIIPTIGRSDYLYDVLLDLKSQNHLPTNIIIVEQNPDEGSESELNYLTNEKWPFAIKHIFTHKAGACNARNIALEQITSEWVFFADDDIRINVDFIQKTLGHIRNLGTKAVTLRCFQKNEKLKLAAIFQWESFGSGCSFVFADSLRHSKFRGGYEFGFGEDADFGMQLRNQGQDVLYLPDPAIQHLKAPIGGFRANRSLQWQNDVIQPKPSPTIMLYEILHHTKEQTLGYKTILFFKYYKHQKIKNPISYFVYFQKQWRSSFFWANELKKV